MISKIVIIIVAMMIIMTKIILIIIVMIVMIKIMIIIITIIIISSPFQPGGFSAGSHYILIFLSITCDKYHNLLKDFSKRNERKNLPSANSHCILGGVTFLINIT